MSIYSDFAELFKERNNKDPYAPIAGIINSDFSVKVHDMVVLGHKHLQWYFDVTENDIGKQVLLLPFGSKFAAIGVLR